MWARNSFQHELLPAAHLINTVPPTIVSNRPGSRSWIPGPIYDYRWKSLADLPAKPDKYNRHLSYDRFVAGRELVPPLDSAAGWLRAIQ